MQTVTSFGDIKGELHKRGGQLADDAVARAAHSRAVDPRRATTRPSRTCASRASRTWRSRSSSALQPASAAAERVLRAGRALVEIAEGTERLDAAGVARLRQLVDRAAVDVVRAIEARARRAARRLAVVPLARAEEPAQHHAQRAVAAARARRRRAAGGRFIELAERAVKKLEERIRDLKASISSSARCLPAGKVVSHAKRTLITLPI